MGRVDVVDFGLTVRGGRSNARLNGSFAPTLICCLAGNEGQVHGE